MLKLWQNILHLGISPLYVGINFRFPSRCLPPSSLSSSLPRSDSPHSTFLWMQLWQHLPPPPWYTPPHPLAGHNPENWPPSQNLDRLRIVRERGGGDWKIEASTLLHLNPVKHIMSITHLCLPRPPLIICQTLLGRRQPTDSRKLQSNDHWPSSSSASSSLYWSTGTGLLFVVVNILIFRYFIWLT